MLPTSFQSAPTFHSPLYDQRNADGSDADMMSGQNPQWARWFDALQGMAGDQGKELRIGPMDGLPTDDHYGTVPLMYQDRPGAEMGNYDGFGFPTSVAFNKKPPASLDALGKLQGAGQYVDANGHVQIRK